MAHGGIFFPDSEDGLNKFVAPKHFEVHNAVAPEDAKDPSATHARNIAGRFRLDCGNASAHQPKQVLADAQGADQRPADCAGEVLRQAFDKAPRLPVAGSSSASSFDEQI